MPLLARREILNEYSEYSMMTLMRFLKTDETHITLRKNGRSELSSLLLDDSYAPENGWGVIFLIDGAPYMSAQGSPEEAMQSIQQELENHGFELNEHSVGLSCNAHWLSAAPEEHHLIHVGELWMAGKEVFFGEIPEGHILHRPFRHPQSWGAAYWLHLGHELAMDAWDYNDFRSLVLKLQENLNPEVNPSRGCQRCFQHGMPFFTTYAEEEHSQEESRNWLLEFHNSVNETLDKPILTYQEAEKIYGW